jgi:kexin
MVGLPQLHLMRLVSSHLRWSQGSFCCFSSVVYTDYATRPDLTWRDMQYLCVQTARKINPEDPDWENTASGRPYSYKYGYGSLDGYAYVKAALDHKLVKPQSWFRTAPVQVAGGTMSNLKVFKKGQFILKEGVTSTMEITKQMLQDNNFEFLEHIDIRVWIQHGRRGDVEVELISPHGIRSILGGMRRDDAATTSYPGWKFMTVKHW